MYIAYQILVELGINKVWKVFSRLSNLKPSVMRNRYNDALSMPSILDFGEKIREYLRECGFWVSSTSTTVRVRPIFYPKYRRTFAPDFRTPPVQRSGAFPFTISRLLG